MMPFVRILFLVALLGLANEARAQMREVVSDTTKIVDTTHRTDSIPTRRTPSKLAERVAKFHATKVEPKIPPFSFYDSLRIRFCSERYNQKPAVDRAFFRSAGDYFRYAPQFFVLPYRETPMRTTVAPFGLTNSRVNWILHGNPVTLFEHVPEMDGMADAEDLPTTGDQSAYVLPGPTGMLFGGEQALATLITAPESLSTTDAHSTMLVDKGFDGYSMTRGRYAKLFGDGRRTDLSTAYRKAGFGSVPRDDSYHYAADFRVPIGNRWTVDAQGWLYTRDGRLAISGPSGVSIGRYRFERQATVSLIKSDSAHSTRTEIKYEHARQGSHFGIEYGRWFDEVGHVLMLDREWKSGATLYSARGKISLLRYDNQLAKYDRATGDLSVSAAKPVGGWQTAISVGSRYNKSFKAMPYGVATAMREREKSLMHLSVGYIEKAPTLHEMYLPPAQTALVTDGFFYADDGDSTLVSERQLVGTFYGELGSRDNAIGMSVTGGRIENGVEWIRLADSAYRLTTPANVSRSFTGVSATSRFRIADIARFHAGFGYNYAMRSDDRPRYFAPKTQAFAGLELHWNWTQKLIHLRGYGELVYTGPYRGYAEQSLGDNFLVNSTLTFQMGGFRFFYVFRNMFDIQYDSRDYLSTGGRYVSYGFVWNFIN